MIKRFFDFNSIAIRNKKVNFCLYERNNEKGKRDINLSIMELSKLVDCPGYENDWGIGRIKFITIWKNYKGSPKQKS